MSTTQEQVDALSARMDSIEKYALNSRVNTIEGTLRARLNTLTASVLELQNTLTDIQSDITTLLS